jgi:hypothetical protein
VTITLTDIPDISQSRALLDFCAVCGVTKFTANFLYAGDDRAAADVFLRQFEPFLGGNAVLERTVYVRKQFQERPFYQFTSQSRELILAVCGGSLLAYDVLSYPEDWTFYREEELFFAIVSHEQHAFFRFSESDYSRFLSLGIPHAPSHDIPVA